MSRENHINITVAYQDNLDRTFDLRVPTHQTVKKFIEDLDQTLHLERSERANGIFKLKVVNKGLVLTDNQVLQQFPVTTGDYIIIY